MEKVDFADVRPATGDIRNTHINIGTGKELSIREVAFLIREKVGFTARSYLILPSRTERCAN